MLLRPVINKFPFFLSLSFQAAVYLDDKVEKVGRLIHKREKRVRRWYHRITYGEEYPDGSEAFYFGFIGGSFFGLMSGCLL